MNWWQQLWNGIGAFFGYDDDTGLPQVPPPPKDNDDDKDKEKNPIIAYMPLIIIFVLLIVFLVVFKK